MVGVIKQFTQSTTVEHSELILVYGAFTPKAPTATSFHSFSMTDGVAEPPERRDASDKSKLREVQLYANAK